MYSAPSLVATHTRLEPGDRIGSYSTKDSLLAGLECSQLLYSVESRLVESVD